VGKSETGPLTVVDEGTCDPPRPRIQWSLPAVRILEGGPLGASRAGVSAVCGQSRGNVVCTLPPDHASEHEAWACICSGEGRCDDQNALLDSWTTGI
jgi:hypothetical protein